MRHLPAFLDAIFPGLGHYVAGRRRRAALFAIPFLMLIALAVAVILFTPTIRLVAMALDPTVLAAFFGIQALILIWRLIAVASSLTDPALPRVGRRDAIPVVLIAMLLIVPQAYAGIATNVAREVTDEIVPLNPETAGAWLPPQAGDRGNSNDFDLPSPSARRRCRPRRRRPCRA